MAMLRSAATWPRGLLWPYDQGWFRRLTGCRRPAAGLIGKEGVACD